jgi:hypothetical protein
MPEPKDKAVEESHITKTPEYRRFKKLLKKVVKAPPLRKTQAKSVYSEP